MKEKLKTHAPIPLSTASGEPGGDGLADAEQQMNALLAAGDAAITAALSTGNSEAFLDSTRQRGGQ